MRIHDDIKVLGEMAALKTLVKIMMSHVSRPTHNPIKLTVHGPQCITFAIDAMDTTLANKRNRIYSLKRLLDVVRDIWVNYIIMYRTNID